MTNPLDRRVQWLRESTLRSLGRDGAVVQTSGGIDSAVTLHLATRALGADRVIALYLPDRSSDPDSEAFARLAARSSGARFVLRSIREEMQVNSEATTSAIRRYFPQYSPTSDGFSLNLDVELFQRLGLIAFRIGVGPLHADPVMFARISGGDLRLLLARQNRKQRFRMLCAYELAEAANYAVIGASNADELRTGFVVKYGDDAVDLCAIGDVSKEGVYELAAQLAVPDALIERTPTTDTFALRQSQDDYYYGLPPAALRAVITHGAGAPRDCPDFAFNNWNTDALENLAATLRAALAYNRARSLLIQPPEANSPDH